MKVLGALLLLAWVAPTTAIWTETADGVAVNAAKHQGVIAPMPPGGQPRQAPGGQRGQAPGGQPSVTKTSHSGPFEEIQKAGGSAAAGAVLIFLSFPVLWFNEKRQVVMWRLFGRARGMVVPDVPCEKVDDQNEARLVHACGLAHTSEELRDTEFGITVTDSAKLERTVQMLQWIESEREEERDTWNGGKETVTTYSYAMDWSEEEVHSSEFQESEGHENPPFPFKSTCQQAIDLNLGAFRLSERLIGKMCSFTPLAHAELCSQACVGPWVFEMRGSYYTTEARVPQIGDMRVTFQKVPCGDCTVLAVQHSGSFIPLTCDMDVVAGKVVSPAGYADKGPELKLRGGCCSVLCGLVGGIVQANQEIYELAESQETAATMLARAENEQQLYYAALQILGFLMLLFGWTMIFKLVPALFRVVPVIGTWIQAFGNFIAYVAAFVVAGCQWSITVAVAWLAMRPVKALLLLAAACLIIAVPTYLSHRA